MKFHKNKFLTTVAAAALVLAVGACSSGNDDGLTAERDTALEDLKAAAAARDAAQARVTELEGQLETANGMVTDLQGRLDMANADLGTANDMVMSIQGMLDTANADVIRLMGERNAALDNADAIQGMLDTANADVTRLMSELTDAGDNAASIQGMLDTANADVIRLMGELTDAGDNAASIQGMLDTANADVTRLTDALAMANTRADDAEDEVDRLTGELDVANAQLASITAENKRLEAAAAAKADSDKAKAVLTSLGEDSVAPSVTLAASSSGAVTAKAAGYTMSANAPDAITGYRGAILTTDTGELHVYTNIDDAVATPIGDIYRASSDPGEPKVYTVAASTTVDDILWSQAKRDDSVTTVTGEDTDAVTTFAGNVRGVAGTFSCTGTTCEAPTVAQGADVLSGFQGTWTFVPTDPNGKIDVADVTYLSFGWWLNQMADESYETDVFAAASTGMGAAVENLAADDVDGSATYKGGAAGKWAMQSTSDDSASGGHFTATATLTANFDANTAAEGAQPNTDGVSIGGTVTNFMTGETSRPNWKVTLTAPDATTAVGPITGAVTEWATGGALKGTGMWSANFYGSETDTMHPMAATGEFNAAIPTTGEVGRISGAFAATKQ